MLVRKIVLVLGFISLIAVARERFDFVFDIDNVLVTKNVYPSTPPNRVIQVDDENYRVVDGMPELLQFLTTQNPAVSLSVVSNREKARNEALLSQYLLPNGTNLRDQLHALLSREDILASQGEGVNLNDYRKNLLLIPELNLDQAVFFDDDIKAVFGELQHRNFIRVTARNYEFHRAALRGGLDGENPASVVDVKRLEARKHALFYREANSALALVAISANLLEVAALSPKFFFREVGKYSIAMAGRNLFENTWHNDPDLYERGYEILKGQFPDFKHLTLRGHSDIASDCALAFENMPPAPVL
jgi:hypothetical protein